MSEYVNLNTKIKKEIHTKIILIKNHSKSTIESIVNDSLYLYIKKYIEKIKEKDG